MNARCQQGWRRSPSSGSSKGVLEQMGCCCAGCSGRARPQPGAGARHQAHLHAPRAAARPCRAHSAAKRSSRRAHGCGVAPQRPQVRVRCWPRCARARCVHLRCVRVLKLRVRAWWSGCSCGKRNNLRRDYTTVVAPRRQHGATDGLLSCAQLRMSRVGGMCGGQACEQARERRRMRPSGRQHARMPRRRARGACGCDACGRGSGW
jgi:hypothetical protein